MKVNQTADTHCASDRKIAQRAGKLSGCFRKLAFNMNKGSGSGVSCICSSCALRFRLLTESYFKCDVQRADEGGEAVWQKCGFAGIMADKLILNYRF